VRVSAPNSALFHLPESGETRKSTSATLLIKRTSEPNSLVCRFCYVVVVVRSWRIYDFALPLLRYQIAVLNFSSASFAREPGPALIWRGKRRRF
jgi:hypothetical protein